MIARFHEPSTPTTNILFQWKYLRRSLFSSDLAFHDFGTEKSIMASIPQSQAES